MIRRPDVLGRATQRRLVGVTSALSAATVEAAAVGLWFVLVVVETRTLFTALAGLGVLLFGSLVRTGVFDAVAGRRSRDASEPIRFALALVLATCWLTWLVAAELVGGQNGILVAFALLASTLSLQFSLERRWYGASGGWPSLTDAVKTVAAGVVVAAGASLLLAATWFLDWRLVVAYVPVGDLTLALEIGGLAVGLASYGVCSFLGQQQRIARALES
ncbi:hypothetical protein [Natronobiforma cellulositropha]|uniref:hypothetical protein n=1 Tax=Natronobiforma cellulositropha TaxID=1679076 RepID=UPI003CCD1538